MHPKLNKLFTYCFLFFLITLAPFLLWTSKGAFSLWCSNVHSPAGDFVFLYLTHLGSGYFVVLAGLLCLYWNRNLGLKILIGYAVSGILVQMLKKLVFKGFPRPVEYFKEISDQLHWIEGLQLNHWNSFPSGHTASAFLLAAALSFKFESKGIQLLLFLYACLVAFSRVYLLEHFLMDVYAGAAIGFLTAIIMEYLLKNDKGPLSN